MQTMADKYASLFKYNVVYNGVLEVEDRTVEDTVVYGGGFVQLNVCCLLCKRLLREKVVQMAALFRAIVLNEPNGTKEVLLQRYMKYFRNATVGVCIILTLKALFAVGWRTKHTSRRGAHLRIEHKR